MALDFPANPTNGQVYDSYVYNSAVGAWQAREDSRTVAVLSSTVPATANPGDIWINTNDGIAFVYYDDGTSAQWIEMLPSGVPLLSTKADLSGGNTFSDSQLIISTTIAQVPLTIKGVSGQSANLQEWEDSASAVLAGINPYGGIFTGNRLTVGASSISTAAVTVLNTINAGNIGLIVKGSVSQSSNLQEWQNSSGTALSYINKDGELFAKDLTLTKDTAHIELGGITGTANTPYIDFHSSAVYSDYNARIIADGGTASNASGNLSIQAGQLNLPTKTYMPGAIVQAIEVRGASGDKSATTSPVDIISTTFTTKLAGSKLLLTWHSGQMSYSGPQVNAMIFFTIDGVDLSDFSTNHYFYGDNNTAIFRPVVTIPVMTGALTQGSHTVKVRGQAYNGTVTYDFQSNSSTERRGRLVIMEVAQ